MATTTFIPIATEAFDTEGSLSTAHVKATAYNNQFLTYERMPLASASFPQTAVISDSNTTIISRLHSSAFWTLDPYVVWVPERVAEMRVIVNGGTGTESVYVAAFSAELGVPTADELDEASEEVSGSSVEVDITVPVRPGRFNRICIAFRGELAAAGTPQTAVELKTGGPGFRLQTEPTVLSDPIPSAWVGFLTDDNDEVGAVYTVAYAYFDSGDGDAMLAEHLPREIPRNSGGVGPNSTMTGGALGGMIVLSVSFDPNSRDADLRYFPEMRYTQIAGYRVMQQPGVAQHLHAARFPTISVASPPVDNTVGMTGVWRTYRNRELSDSTFETVMDIPFMVTQETASSEALGLQLRVLAARVTHHDPNDDAKEVLKLEIFDVLGASASISDTRDLDWPATSPDDRLTARWIDLTHRIRNRESIFNGQHPAIVGTPFTHDGVVAPEDLSMFLPIDFELDVSGLLTTKMYVARLLVRRDTESSDGLLAFGNVGARLFPMVESP